MDLTDEEKAEVALDLVASLDAPRDADAEDAWVAEIERRARRALANPDGGEDWSGARAAIRIVEQRLTTVFPPDYVASMRESDGGEGDVGTEGYIQLWPIGALVERPKATSPVSCSWVRTAAMKALGLRSGANGSSYS
jgi:hypothetical protein